MSDRPRDYQSYLLRLWRTGQGTDGGWRASLEDTRSGQRHGFASLDAAFSFLDQQTVHAVEDQAGGSDPPYISITERTT